MKAPTPELSDALSRILDKIDRNLDQAPPQRRLVMYLAGGVAVNFYCGTRYTEDVDASFSQRLLLDQKAMTVDYTRHDGTPAWLYLDTQYNPTLGLIHPDFQEAAVRWNAISDTKQHIELRVLTPIDLAVSKVSRCSDRDKEDIRALANERLIDSVTLKQRAIEALDYYIGDKRPVHFNLSALCSEIDRIRGHNPASTKPVQASLDPALETISRPGSRRMASQSIGTTPASAQPTEPHTPPATSIPPVSQLRQHRTDPEIEMGR